jgi:transposase
VAFRKEQELQVKLHQAESNHEVRVYYFDAAGFTTIPCVPYAWQKKSETLKLPSQRSKQLNVLGFLNKDNDCFFYEQEGSVTSQTVIDAFEAFGQRYAEYYARTKQPGIVIVDNAPVHTSATFLKKIEDWYSYGLVVHLLPTYSPELNLIEILWRKIKYEWLPFEAYLSYANLKTEVLNVLSQVGKKYTITYA